MNTSQQQSAIERIHASGKQILLAVTGGGSGAIPALLEVPGASKCVVGAVVPYAEAALRDVLGGPVDQACSERTARAMAMRAFELARRCSGADVHSLRGIGVTASLATSRPKRGDHRVHVAWQSADATVAISCELEKGTRTRAQEERVATSLVLDMVADACDVATAPFTEPAVNAAAERREQRAAIEWSELLLGRRRSVDTPVRRPSVQPPEVLFPGAFNPFHEGHRRMAETAAARCGAAVTFELSITNVDKPPLDFIEIADRLGPLSNEQVLLTRAATFVEKAQLAPGTTFVVGIDTLQRIAEVRYYDHDVAGRDAAIAAISQAGCRFLVFGRQLEDRFCTLAGLDIPQSLRVLCDEISETEFREDISSSQLRQHG